MRDAARVLMTSNTFTMLSLRSLRLFLIAFGFAACEAQDITAEREVWYGETDGQKLLLDAFRPASHATTPRPAVIFVHGGELCFMALLQQFQFTFRDADDFIGAGDDLWQFAPP